MPKRTDADAKLLEVLEARVGKRRRGRGDSIRARNQERRRLCLIRDLLTRAFGRAPGF
jgi:hypothetical protein